MPDREKVIEQLESMRDYHRSAGNNITADIASDALELLKEQEPVVRCKDCKYMERLPWLDDEDFKAMVCRKHNYTGMRKEDFFCADGERRDEND